MANLNVKFFIDNDEKEKKEKVPSLKFYAARLVYYINVNLMFNLHKAAISYYNCNCRKFSGCRKPNKIMDYCDYCSLAVKHNPYDYEKDYKIKNIIDKHIEMVKDFKKYNIDITNEDYTSKTWSPYFYEFSFYKSVFCESLFIDKKTFY